MYLQGKVCRQERRLERIADMDFKPIPPSGKVEDLRNVAPPPTPEQQEDAKQARRDKTRKNLRIIALCVAFYYFGSAFYSWYEESQHEANAVSVVNVANPLKDPQAFREHFNTLINSADTSLPIATANDSSSGFVAVLSPALELQGRMKPQSKELQELQIQTRYPDAFPPESIVAFRSFVLACEQLVEPNASYEQADQLLNQLGIIPQVDANEDNKMFPNSVVRSNAYEYRTLFTGGPIDELTLIAVPLANLEPAAATSDDPNVISRQESTAQPAEQSSQIDKSAMTAEQTLSNAPTTEPSSAPTNDAPVI